MQDLGNSTGDQDDLRPMKVTIHLLDDPVGQDTTTTSTIAVEITYDSEIERIVVAQAKSNPEMFDISEQLVNGDELFYPSAITVALARQFNQSYPRINFVAAEIMGFYSDGIARRKRTDAMLLGQEKKFGRLQEQQATSIQALKAKTKTLKDKTKSLEDKIKSLEEEINWQNMYIELLERRVFNLRIQAASS